MLLLNSGSQQRYTEMSPGNCGLLSRKQFQTMGSLGLQNGSGAAMN